MRKSIDIANDALSVNEIFQHRVRAVIANDGLRITDVAQKLDMTQQNFVHALNGSRCTIVFAAKIAKALDVSLDWLCGLVD